MGMLACYMEADRELIERLKTESGEEIFEEIEEIDEEGEAGGAIILRTTPNDLSSNITSTSTSSPLPDSTTPYCLRT